MIDVLVVDDERLARARLRQLIEGEPDLRLVGECANGQEAIDAIREGRPALMFLDIDMPDMSGFDVLEALHDSIRPAVVFVTAHDEFAVRAFRVHALDYLLKPLDAARFRDAVARARTHIGSPRSARPASIAAVLEELRSWQRSVERSVRHQTATWPERLVVKEGRELVFVAVGDVDWIAAADNYVELHVGRKVHLLRETLSGIEGRLDPRQFVRIRRDAIVNVSRVQVVRPGTNGEPDLILRDGTTLRLGRAFRGRVTHRWQGGAD
jgi:two-component system LytT family response regulator